ncbi:hypothetical protein Ndes2437A_g01468 [Nannochloris sp. 'desiccata']|nr:hypothetical protein KSW81_006528 [Chlorella desiccata (nom. nud.)]
MGRFKVLEGGGLYFTQRLNNKYFKLFIMLILLHIFASTSPALAQPTQPTFPTSPPPEITPPAPIFNASTLLRAMGSVPTTHYVANDQDLWIALQQAPIRDLGIVFTDNIELKDPIWSDTPTIEIPPGRVVEFRAPLTSYPDITRSIDAIKNAGGKILDLYNRTEVISVAENGTLAYEGIYVTGSPPISQYLSGPFKATRPHPYGLATFPSVLCDPGCQIAHNYTVVNYYDSNGDCSDEGLRNIVFRAGIALNNASAAGIVEDAPAVYLIGQGTFTFPVLDPSQGNITVGNANVLVNTTVRNCLLESGTAAGAGSGDHHDDGGGMAPWAWALIGLAIAFAVVGSIFGAFIILRRRRRKKDLLPMRNRNNRVLFDGPPALSASGIAGAAAINGSLAPTSEDGRPPYSSGAPLLLPAASMSANTMDVAAAAAMDLDVAALIQLRDAWRSRIGRVHGLEFQEAVGRGAFGTVFKSTWRGTQVAVKLVEHGVDGGITKQIQREAALATSCSHPNIVVTYKVATSGLGDLQKLPHYVEVSAAAAANASLASAGEVELTPLGSDSGTGGTGGGGTGGASTSKNASASTISSSFTSSREDEDVSMPADSSTDEKIATASPPRTITPTATPTDAATASPITTPPSSIVPGDLVATLIIMEFCDLGSMKDGLYIQQAYTLNNDVPSDNTNQRDAVGLLRTLIDVALGLDYLHTAAGVVHGDIKPGNVLLKSSGNTKRGWIAKLGDFGVARALEGGLAQTTMMGAAVRPGGTLSYMSPEMLETGLLTAASDTYAFGILMWEGWTGLPPFGESKNSNHTGRGRGGGVSAAAQFFLRAGSGQRPPLDISEASGMPETYADLMVRCWQQEMKDRPAMAAVVVELREILKEVLGGMEGAVVESNNTHFLQLLRVNK